MINLSKLLAKNSDRPAFTRVASLVLVAFLINILSGTGTFASVVSSANGAPTDQGIANPSPQQNVKPCHHNHIKYGKHATANQSGQLLDAVPNDDLCCTNDNRSGELQVALRSKRDRDLTTSAESTTVFLSPGSVNIASFDAIPVRNLAQQTAQLSGLLGATAEFVHTVRLLN